MPVSSNVRPRTNSKSSNGFSVFSSRPQSTVPPSVAAACSLARATLALPPLRSIKLLEPMPPLQANHFVAKSSQEWPAPARFPGWPQAHGLSEHESTPAPEATASREHDQPHGAAAHRGVEFSAPRERTAAHLTSVTRYATACAIVPTAGPNPALKRTRSGGRRLAPISFWAKRHPPLRSA